MLLPDRVNPMASIPPLTGNGHSLVALHWNAHGLRSRLPEIQLLANRYNPCVMALQETMAKETDLPRNYLGGRYKWYIKPHTNATIHGVGLAVREDIPHKVVQLETELETIAVTISFPFVLTIASVYMAPRNRVGLESNVIGMLQDVVRQLPAPYVIVGDLNAHHPSWGSHKVDVRGERLRQLLDMLGSSVLNDGRPTRLDPSTGAQSVVDLSIASWDVASRFTWQVDDDLHGSDHFPILLSQAVDTPSTAARLRWSIEKADWDGFSRDIRRQLPDGHGVLTPTEWGTLIREAADRHIPKAGGNGGNKRVPWWNTEVYRAIKLRRKHLRALRRLAPDDPRRPSKLKEFQLARAKARRVIWEAKEGAWTDFTAKITETTSSAELWRKVKAVSGKNRHAEKVIRVQDGFTNDPVTVAEAFADQFAKVSANSNFSESFLHAKSLAEAEFCYSLEDEGDLSLEIDYNKDFSLNELNWALSHGTGKAAGPDDIGYPILRKLPLIGRLALLDTMNQVWHSGAIPDEWKEGLVIPIPKEGKDKTLTEGYRPITLLSCMGKTLERMVNRRLSTELERHERIHPQQHAFRCGYGAETFFSQLDCLLEKASSEGLHVDVISLDLSKAYDMTWRLPILTTLKRWDIQGRMFNYVANFLRNRSFRVLNAGATSSSRLLENGIPQGSVISVTLFLIAMNSVFERIPPGVHLIVYADDMTLVFFGKYARRVRSKMQQAVDCVVEWADSVGFKISPEKSNLMHVCFDHTHRPALPPISIGEHAVKAVRDMRLLGLLIDNKLTFIKHAKQVKEKLNSKLNILRALSGRFSEASRSTLIKVARAMCVPSVLYGSELWSRGSTAVLNILEPQYNEIFRICSGAFKTSPVASLLVECGRLPLVHLVAEDLATKAARALERDHLAGGMPVVQRASSQWHDLTSTNLPSLVTRPRLWQRAWDADVPKIDWRVREKCGAGANPAVAQATFREVAASYADRPQYFTDGSLVQEEVGYGVSGEAISRCGRLPGLCGIFSAEAYALLQACRHANGSQAVVFSDSASCLSALEHGKVGHPWLIEVQQYTNITFVWVPGHAGIPGNEAADVLANQGRHAPQEVPSVPLCDVTRWIKRTSRETWDSAWYHNRDAFLRRIKNDTQEWRDVPNSRDQKILTRLRIGHTRLTHGSRFGGNTAYCQGCGQILDVTHILVDCPARELLRAEHGVRGSILEVLANDRNAERGVIKLIRALGLYDAI